MLFASNIQHCLQVSDGQIKSNLRVFYVFMPLLDGIRAHWLVMALLFYKFIFVLTRES